MGVGRCSSACTVTLEEFSLCFLCTDSELFVHIAEMKMLSSQMMMVVVVEGEEG